MAGIAAGGREPMAGPRQRYFVVDAFTDRPFAGNPAAVVPLARWPADDDDGWMQAVAAEMNLSETAFLVPSPSAAAFGLRWFTPRVEVDSEAAVRAAAPDFRRLAAVDCRGV